MFRTITQSYAHKIQLVSGSPEAYALMITAPVKANESFVAGSLVSMDGNGLIVAGCGDADVALFAINGTADQGVALDALNGANTGVGNAPITTRAGNVNCHVATGGTELFTTEFVTGEGITYPPATKLTNGTSGDVGKVKGSLAKYSMNNVVGIVSRGVQAYQGYNVLFFWPTFCPKVSALS